MLDDDTDRLLRQVYSAMLYIKDENGKDGKETGRMSIKVGKKVTNLHRDCIRTDDAFVCSTWNAWA